MTQEEIIQGNKLVADFDGWKPWEHDSTKLWHPERNITSFISVEDIQYHSSWDWIMPVWIKFRGLALKNGDYEQWVHSLSWYLYSSDSPFRLFDRLVYAIKWYNQNKQP